MNLLLDNGAPLNIPNTVSRLWNTMTTKTFEYITVCGKCYIVYLYLTNNICTWLFLDIRYRHFQQKRYKHIYTYDMKYECNNYCYERSCKEKRLLALQILTNTVSKCSPSCEANKLVHLQLFSFQIIIDVLLINWMKKKDLFAIK